MLYCCLSIDRRWECFCNQVGVILTCALMGDFVKENHFGVGISTSTFDAFITGVVDDAVQFSFFSESLEIEGCLRENWVINNLLDRGYAHK